MARSVLDDMHYVKLICDSQRHRTHPKSHPHRPGSTVVANVAMFWFDDETTLEFEPQQWRQSAPLSGQTTTTDTTVDANEDGFDAWLGWIERVAAPAKDKPGALQRIRDEGSTDPRLRWNLRCPLSVCGLTVPARDERLQQVLSNLDTAGWRQVNLSGLALLLRGASVDDLTRLAATLA